jgi:hypothetical protein
MLTSVNCAFSFSVQELHGTFPIYLFWSFELAIRGRYSFLLRSTFWGMFSICNCELVSSHFLRIHGTFPILPVIAGLNFASKEPEPLHDCSFLNVPSLYNSCYSNLHCRILYLLLHTSLYGSPYNTIVLVLYGHAPKLKAIDDDDDSVHCSQFPLLWYSTLLSYAT